MEDMKTGWKTDSTFLSSIPLYVYKKVVSKPACIVAIFWKSKESLYQS